MDAAELYHETRGRLLAVAPELTHEQRAAPVPALPGWSVRDTYAHLAGVCADALDGRLDGVATPPWTAAQLAARVDCTFDDLTAEWAARGPDFDAALQVVTGRPAIMAAVDVWSHEQDIRGALGREGGRADERVDFLVERSLEAYDERFAAADLALAIVVDGDQRIVGRGSTGTTWTTSGYELVRTLTGRRTPSQITASGWRGDPSPYLDHLHLFDFPAHDLVD
jgi:uncharacterized protein (TIGR03083 family)